MVEASQQNRLTLKRAGLAVIWTAAAVAAVYLFFGSLEFWGGFFGIAQILGEKSFDSSAAKNSRGDEVLVRTNGVNPFTGVAFQLKRAGRSPVTIATLFAWAFWSEEKWLDPDHLVIIVHTDSLYVMSKGVPKVGAIKILYMHKWTLGSGRAVGGAAEKAICQALSRRPCVYGHVRGRNHLFLVLLFHAAQLYFSIHACDRCG